MTIYVYFGWEPIVAVLLINAIGVAAGFIVTNVFGFPKDGGYRDPDIRREFDQDVVERIYENCENCASNSWGEDIAVNQEIRHVSES